MIRYWHWLVSQKKPEPTDYIVNGTAEIDSEYIDFDPEYDWYDYEEDGLIINVEQNENA